MKPRITLIILGVDDLERAVAFNRDGLGWATEDIVGTGIWRNVGSKEEVSVVMGEAGSAGAVIVNPAQTTFLGMRDSEGHYLAVA